MATRKRSVSPAVTKISISQAGGGSSGNTIAYAVLAGVAAYAIYSVWKKKQEPVWLDMEATGVTSLSILATGIGGGWVDMQATGVANLTILATGVVGGWTDMHATGVTTLSIGLGIPTSTGFRISLMSGDYPTAVFWTADFGVYHNWTSGYPLVTDMWICDWGTGIPSKTDWLIIDLYAVDEWGYPTVPVVVHREKYVTIENGMQYEYYPLPNQLIKIGPF